MKKRFQLYGGMRWFVFISLSLHGTLFAVGGIYLCRSQRVEAEQEPDPILIELAEWNEPVQAEEVEPVPPPQPVVEPEPAPEPIPETEVAPALEPVPAPEPEPTLEPESVPTPEVELPAEKVAEPETITPPEPMPVEAQPEPVAATATATTSITVKQPDYLRNPTPPYPIEARENGWEGTALIRVEVSPNGRAVSAMVVKSSGHALLDETALKTVRRWRFSPARLGGESIAATIEVPITFVLRRGTARIDA